MYRLGVRTRISSEQIQELKWIVQQDFNGSAVRREEQWDEKQHMWKMDVKCDIAC